MTLQEVTIEQDFPCKIHELFVQISDHERFGDIIGQAISRCKPAEAGDPNGLGSVRRIALPLGLCFEETITRFEPNRLIEYRVTKGSPVKHHCGTLTFDEHGDGCRLHYHIQFAPRWPLPGLGILLKHQIRAPLATGMTRLAASFA